MTSAVCPCLQAGPKIARSTYLGVDETEGRFADVEIVDCPGCGLRWLRYFVEYEAFSRSGRWAAAPIGEGDAASMTPESAPGWLAAQPWRLAGGSYFGGKVARGSGPVHWGL